eukprot:TRINITY_DN11167_c0_g3_i1.p1 TRINITY_DN11167_c0_g3~~TRINITY_DN11167_c0_g3_i1.p1  ORF type:complete len:317 (+),score=49.40 TRINITY_DN11167_c0_g3_i1:118-1068(+)
MDIPSAQNCEELFRIASSGTPAEQDALGLKPLVAGFANHVWSLESNGTHFVVKVYTDLLLLRLDEHAVGAVELLAGQCGLGPQVYLSNLHGLVMEWLPGRTLQEADIHCGNHSLLEAIAGSLEKLHNQKIPEVCRGEPMLWRTIHRMLDVAKRRPDLLPRGLPLLDAIQAEIVEARAALERYHPVIVCGHGDFKPSNVIEHDGNIRLIDFELGGPNYRGFDWMKLFRTAGGYSETDLRHFLKAYSAGYSEFGSEDVDQLVQETVLFEPLTWLEAFVFFLALPQFKPESLSKWHELAEHRWKLYHETKHRLTQNITA